MHQSQTGGKLLKTKGYDLKTSRNEEEFEHSRASLDYLCNRIQTYLAREFGIDNPWFLDSPDWSKFKKETNNSPIDLVLFGSYIQRFLETGNLPNGDYRFWVLSTKVKEVLTTLFNFPKDSLAVIPREAITSKGVEQIFNGQSFDLVHSGRISPVKNIEMYLLFSYYLQKDHGLDCRPVLFGDFDNITHDHHGRLLPSDYRVKISNLCSSLDWSISPEFEGLYPSNEWVKNQKLNSPVFCSFSTYSKEDFGVSLAQAQEQGWPTIISSWGGHLDSTGDNIYHIPLEYIGESTDELSVIKGRARALARDFINNHTHFSSNKLTEEKTQLPAPLSVSQLDQLRRTTIEKWGPEIQYITRQLTDHFADTNSGRIFYQKFESLFGYKTDSAKKVLIIHDY
ncbi:MAG: glycosyltransferase family 1 protein, partial [Deltaproteobacteria bacterium]